MASNVCLRNLAVHLPLPVVLGIVDTVSGKQKFFVLAMMAVITEVDIQQLRHPHEGITLISTLGKRMTDSFTRSNVPHESWFSFFNSFEEWKFLGYSVGTQFTSLYI